MNVKQVLVIRKDLNMRKGKIASQASHASMGALLKMIDVKEGAQEEMTLREWWLPTDSPVNYWLNNSFTKICVSVDSEEELVTIYEEAERKLIPCCLITDNGTTEFGGVPTKTAVAIGPWHSDEINKITGHLKLM